MEQSATSKLVSVMGMLEEGKRPADFLASGCFGIAYKFFAEF